MRERDTFEIVKKFKTVVILDDDRNRKTEFVAVIEWGCTITITMGDSIRNTRRSVAVAAVRIGPPTEDFLQELRDSREQISNENWVERR